MRRLFLFFVCNIFAFLFLNGQSDTIIKVGGKKVVVKIISVDTKSVQFTMKGMSQKLTLDKKTIEKIIYANGKIDHFGKSTDNASNDQKNVSDNNSKTSNTKSGQNSNNQPKDQQKNNQSNSTTKQNTQTVVEKTDTIIKIDGKKILANKIKINETNIAYSSPGKTDNLTILRKDVERIGYGDGKSLDINPKKKPVVANTPAEKLDTIVKLGGRKIICSINKVNVSDVNYKMPGETEIKTIAIKDIEKIIYDNGRLEVFNRPVLAMLDETSWEAVLITESEADVEGLYKRGLITAQSSSDALNSKAAKKNATIRIQKKAAAMKAAIVLITKSEAIGGYGETPGYMLEGIAYGLEPLPDSTNVSDKK